MKCEPTHRGTYFLNILVHGYTVTHLHIPQYLVLTSCLQKSKFDILLPLRKWKFYNNAITVAVSENGNQIEIMCYNMNMIEQEIESLDKKLTPEQRRSRAVKPKAKNPQALNEHIKQLKATVVEPDMPLSADPSKKLNWNLVKELMSKGIDDRTAMIQAGSKAKNTKIVLKNKLALDKNFANDLTIALEKKINMAIEAITQEKLKKESASRNAIVIDILMKNKRLVEGKSTSNVGIGGRIDIRNMTKEEVVGKYRDFLE